MNKESNCIVCNKKLSGRQGKFCSEKCKNKHFQNYVKQRKRGLERKVELAKMLGGKCYICGYDKNLSALVFHNPTKQGKYSTRLLANADFDQIKKELKNYSLLCKNCHTELHFPLDKFPEEDLNKKSLKEEIFENNLKTCQVKNNQTVILAVSSGVDSVTMLNLFVKSKLKFNLIVAHLNHGVREEAAEDEKFARKLTKKYGLKFESKTIQKPKTGNLEEELREERRKFLHEVAKKHKADFIALAHTANDQAETVILNLLRGAGPVGLGGMSMVEENILRPLLNFSKEEIIRYATQNQLEWKEDITNQDVSYSRNYIRHEILPKLSRINTSYLENISRGAEIQRAVTEYLRTETKMATKENLLFDKSGSKIKIPTLQRLDLLIKHELFAQMYESVKGDRKNLSFSHFEDFKELISSDAGTKKIDLPNGIEAIRKYSLLEIRAKKEDNVSLPGEEEIILGKKRFGDWLITAETVKKSAKSTQNEIMVSASDLQKLKIRTWKNGDRIEKRGVTGKKKLQDLFSDAKIDKESRQVWPLIVKNDEIIWIPAIAISRNLKQNENDLVKITAERYK